MSGDEIDTMKTRYILAVFYHTLQGDNWVNSDSWLESKNHRRWKGVNVRANGTSPDTYLPVLEINLASNKLDGSIPSELVHLTKLTRLTLSNNTIEDVGAFRAGLDSLRILDLKSNPLKDHDDIFYLTNLEYVDLSETLSNGIIPDEMQRLSNLRRLDLSHNALKGSLTNQFQTLSNLRSLDLSDNALKGSLTNQFQTMSRLTELNIGNNKLEGTLEDVLNCGTCTNTLVGFRSQRNELRGTIPTSIGKFTQLTHLELLVKDYSLSPESNVLPTEIGMLTNLERLDLSGSTIGGTVPSELSKLSELKTLGLHQTDLKGSIPSEICFNDDLEVIYHSSGVNCTCTQCFKRT